MTIMKFSAIAFAEKSANTFGDHNEPEAIPKTPRTTAAVPVVMRVKRRESDFFERSERVAMSPV